MLALALPFAAAGSELVFDPDDLPPLPLQVQDEDRWRSTDLHQVQLARASIVAGIAALGVGAAGAGIIVAGVETGNEQLTDPLGGTLVFTGIVGAAIAPPVLLASSLRSRRSLKERGVYVSGAPAAVGWTLVGTGIFFTPLFMVAPYTIPLWYGGVVASGLGQLQLNERARSEAGLPRGGQILRGVTLLPEPRGLRLVGAF